MRFSSVGASEDDGSARRVSFARKFTASTIGNILEWYDFAVFGGLADVLGDVFFPASTRTASLLEALAVFGAAFVMRPVGGLMFGWIGDTLGRKIALEMSIAMMLVPSVAIGLLPGYSSIGGFATAALVVLRLCQGVAVGGELVTAYVFVAEHAPSRRGAAAWTGLVLDGSNCGTLLGIGMVAVTRAVLSRRDLYRLGWRLCFCLGLPLGATGIALRRGIGNHEPELIKETGRNPLLEVWRTRRAEVASVAGVSALWCGGFYTSFIWMGLFYAERVSGSDPVRGAYAVNAAMLAVLCMLFVPMALTTRTDDPRAGARRALVRGQLGMLLVSMPAFAIVSASRSTPAAIFAQLLIAPCLASFGAGMPYFLVCSFPPEIRVAAIGIAYNVSQALFGGTAPLVQTALAEVHPVLPGVALSFFALLSYLSLRALERIRNKSVNPSKKIAKLPSIELSTTTTTTTTATKQPPRDDDDNNNSGKAPDTLPPVDVGDLGGLELQGGGDAKEEESAGLC
ncbi:hypothetical protein CTAYLR_006951 [Chrysophaeum taylorii]|uniref:Major facilitator superfamily (MFS) profile domain-containing protein n=1 Tax=Chrysophaeum taylorii TaxID=2483200 RepID=A0AAD7UDK8_9STRA|nr:hypothetical protein CTAYLR_006951 [Chrysophaeum taylorii]